MASPPAALQDARASFAAGRFADAEAVLRRVLETPPILPETLELLGACLGAQGRHAEALEAIDRALGLRPAPPAGALYNRAQALLGLGRVADARAALESLLTRRPDFAPAWGALGRALALLGENAAAERAYRQPLRLDPKSAQALHHLARFLQDTGRLDEAIGGYRRALALDPSLAPAHNDLGNALRAKGARAEALQHYASAVRLAPGFVEALGNYGNALREAGRAPEALPPLEAAARLRPDAPWVLNNLGIALYSLNRFAEAETCHRRALALAPEVDDTHVNLGNVLSAMGRFDEALAAYRTVTARSPGNADAHSNLGIALHDLDRVEEAAVEYKAALALRPDHPDALNNLGFLYEQEGRRDQARALYARALEANPSFARARYNLALALLADFEFARGWQLSDESRFDIIPPVTVRRPLPMPELLPGTLSGVRRLAVWKEQGVGDQVLYSTLLPELERQGVAFVLEADARLVSAFRRAHPAWHVVSPDASAAAFAACDRHVPLASLPRTLRPAREHFAAQPRTLLAADPDRAGAFRERLAGPRRRVGISWRSFQPSIRAHVARRKSAPLDAFRDLSRRDDIDLVDLQYGDTAAEREAFAASGGRLRRLDELDLYNDLDGVLAAIEACDLVITTSNVTAHLAASLGKETWLLFLTGVPSFFYWAADEDGRCLWYPSVRILSGSGRRQWSELVARAEGLLDV